VDHRQTWTKAWDWALFAGAVIAAALVLLTLPRAQAVLWFALLTAGSLGLVVALQWARIVPLVRAHRRTLARGLAALAVVCMALSAYYFRPLPKSLPHYRPTPGGPQGYYRDPAPWLGAAGAVLLLGARFMAWQPVRRQQRRAAVRRGTWWALLPLLCGVALLGALAEINGGIAGVDGLAGASYHVQFALLVAGLALVVIGAAGLARHDPPLRSEPGRWRIGWWALALLLTLGALGVRLWELGERVRVLVDEGHFAAGVTYFWAYPDVRLLEPMQTTASFPFIYSYGQYAFVELLGRNLLGLRALSAVMGALTVPALLLLARYLYDRTTALLAALVLLTFPPHVHFSRLALNNIADPLVGTLALGLLARAFHTRRGGDYALAGAALGLTQYFYEGGRLLFPLLAGTWLLMGLALWWPGLGMRVRPSLRGVILTALVFVIVALPVYLTFAGVDFPLMDRLGKTQMQTGYWQKDREPDNLHTRLVHFRHSLLMYINQPENTQVYYYLYYGGARPLVLEWLVPALLLGAVIALWHWRGPGALPLVWLLATSAGNAALVESAVSPRYVVAFPALALLVAVGARYTLRLLWRGWAAQGLLVALALAAMVGQGRYYFGEHLDLFQHEVRSHVSGDVHDALLRAQDLPVGTHVYIVGEGDLLPQMDAQHFANFLADDLTVEVLPPGEFAVVQPAALQRWRTFAFFVMLDDSATVDRLRAAFDDLAGPYESPYSVPDGKAFVLYVLPRDPNAGRGQTPPPTYANLR
jgi:hypothetical protein